MPKALLDFIGYSFFFWSNESSGNHLEPIHIHVSKGKPTKDATKIWIKPNGIELCHNNSKIPAKDLTLIMKYIAQNRDKIIGKWYQFFG